MTETTWEIIKHDRTASAELASALGVPHLIAALLISRGYNTTESASRYISPKVEHLHDPMLLKGIDDALKRLRFAIERNEKVLIWGDYDVDGTTGTVLLRKALSFCGVKTEYHIPDRFTEGYGINISGLEAAKGRGCSLIITVDCGIRAFDALEWAAENDLDVIVTDHHLTDPVQGNPPAVAIVNPNQVDCSYPDKDLAGVGVAFKLAQAFLRENGDEEMVWSLLKYAAIGTIADIMRLNGENRAIVSLGLEQLISTDDHGLRALMEIAECRNEMTSYDIGFRIAPRINAAGRMDAASRVVELFESENFVDARKIASFLDQQNRLRQSVQQEITETAINAVSEYGDKPVVVVAGDGWHRGVIGLAASRIADKAERPAIVFSIEDGIAHGSARSFAGVNILGLIDSCSELLIQYGGHAAAAGIKMNAELIAEFTDRINSAAGRSDDELGERKQVLTIDANVSSGTMGLNIVNDLSMLEPFGSGNPKPIFMTEGLMIRFEPTIMKEKHLKLYLEDKNKKKFEAVWWDGVERSKGQTLAPGKSIKLAYTPEANNWQGSTRLQLVVVDLKEHN